MFVLFGMRYAYVQVSIETHVLDVIREQLSRRQPVDGGSRNVIRTMTATCGYSEVRSLAAQRLEMWIQNPKVSYCYIWRMCHVSSPSPLIDNI